MGRGRHCRHYATCGCGAYLTYITPDGLHRYLHALALRIYLYARTTKVGNGLFQSETGNFYTEADPIRH